MDICAPTREAWERESRVNMQLYGEQNEFIGQESRRRIAKAIGREEPQNPWWVQYESLRDANGQDISDWRDTTTVTRLYSETEKSEVCEHIKGRMLYLAAKIGSLVIDAT